MLIETNRLLLRSFQVADLERFVAYRSDPAIARFQGWEAPFPVDVARQFIDEMMRQPPAVPGTWYQLAMERRADGLLLGDCAIHFRDDQPRQAEIGFTLARDAQGHGYATEAVLGVLAHLFEALDYHRVAANCDAENARSARLLERVGMRREGHFVESYWAKGRWTSEYHYAILQREWSDRPAGAHRA